ncbi:very long chain fatty acid elongase 4-like [Lasioglossum baleicum]|uniref:very long chain fatty acid elongase 4-like n=1 Tax=Lasioglossum baleicum TaxID=434251 RepID=UPI003FCDA2EC
MGIAELFDYYWNQNLDPRTQDLPLISSNYLLPSILIAYLYIVLKWGPNYMKDKQPYNLKTFIKVYNVVQIFINAYIVTRLFVLGTLKDPTKFCYVPEYLFEPVLVQIAYTIWMAWMSRLIDLIETVIFVLRRKERQVSFLHVYHHLSVLTVGWYVTKFYAIQMAAFPVLVNCIVHVIMYTYYYFSSFGDKTPKILKKLKPFITIMQMVQFVILVIHCLVPHLPSCHVPTTPANVNIANMIILFALFYNFYQKTYKAEKKQKN